MRPCAFGIALLLASVLWPAAARADGIGGYLDYSYSKGDTETRDASGQTTDTKSTVLSQRYRLTLDKRLFPNVGLTAGGSFERSDADSESAGVKSDSTATKWLPFIDLTLNTPLLTLGAAYRRSESRTKINGVSSPTLVREETTGRIGYRPDGFPTLDLQFGRNENFDTARTVRDTVEDFINVSSRYAPVARLQLSYFGAYSDGTDRLLNNETRSATHSGSVSYSGRYWQNRAVYSGMYSVVRRETEFLTRGQGEISIARFPVSGLADLSDTPQQVTLRPNASLINGDTTDFSGFDIGLPPPLTDARPRNLGLDFFDTTEVNTLHVWVDKRLSPEVVNAFAWDVYASDDNFSWSPVATVSPAPFAPFDNRFEIRFRNVTSRFVKVVTRPLASLPPPTAEFPDPTVFRNIRVTELQAFLLKPAAEVTGKSTQMSQTLTLDHRLRLMDVPSVYYQISYFLSKASDVPYRYTLSNALSANHQFSRVVSGSARVSRDDSDDQSHHTVTYIYSASLTAVPLPTLTHNLAYSGRTQESDRGTATFNSLYLTNAADLYKGINANLSGGITFASLEDGEDTRSTTFAAGLSLIPHRTLNVNMSYSDTTSKRTGGGRPDTDSSNSGGTLTVSFTPLRTLYLSGDWSFSRQTGQPRSTATNYTASWAPFPDGTVHFSVSYTESLRSADESRDRTFTPAVRWNINRRASVDGAYNWFRSDSLSQETRSNVYTTHLRVTF